MVEISIGVEQDVQLPKKPEVNFAFKNTSETIGDGEREHITKFLPAYELMWNNGILAAIRRVVSQRSLRNPYVEMRLPTVKEPSHSVVLRWDPSPITHLNSTDKIVNKDSSGDGETHLWKSYGIKVSYSPEGQRIVEYMESKNDEKGHAIKDGGGWKNLPRSISENHTLEEQVFEAKKLANRQYFDMRKGIAVTQLRGSSEMRQADCVKVDFKGGSQIVLREM